MSGPIPQIPGGEIGRRALEGGVAIGNAYIEGHSKCEIAHGSPGCFLDSGVRKNLVNAYQQNVLAAQIEFGGAISDLRVNELLKKPEEVPIFISIAFDVMFSLAGDALKKALAHIRKAPAATLDALDIMSGADSEARHGMMDALRAADPSPIVGVGMSFGKKHATGAFGGGQTEEAAQHLDYLGQIADASALAFEHQRQDPPSSATDVEMIVLFHAWSAAMGHTRGQYAAAIQGQMSRWFSSGASKVGRVSMKNDRTDGMGLSRILRDTKLVFRKSQDPEEPGELWLYKRDYNQNLLTHTQVTDPSAPISDDHADGPTEMRPWKLVEPEFVQEAIARNRQAWGVDYEVMYAVTDYAKMMKPKPKSTVAADAPLAFSPMMGAP